MLERIGRWIATLNDLTSQRALQNCVNPVADRLSCQSHTTAGLVIKAGASPIVKTGGAIWYGTVQGVPRSIAAATDMAALVGSVSNATFNVFAFFVDVAGVLTSVMGTAGATYPAVKFPDVPLGKTMLGYIIVNPTGTGPFVGGTTALDDATVAPGVIYVNTLGAVDPTVLL